MSNHQQEQNNPNESEVKQAVDNVDANQIAENLDTDTDTANQTEQAKDLTEEQAPPFIDESLRTDK